MPLYEVQHSYPLTAKQYQQLAEKITHLHSTTFLTPSLFVHVKFTTHDASRNTYFLAGKPLTASTNRIIGMVRTSEKRTKKHFDDLAAQIEEAWYDVVSGKKIEEGKNEGKRKDEVDDSEGTRQAKKLIVVAFYSMVNIRENGHVVPSAGGEAEWFHEMRDEFQRRADGGDELYKDMLEEVETREDLKKAYGVQ